MERNERHQQTEIKFSHKSGPGLGRFKPKRGGGGAVWRRGAFSLRLLGVHRHADERQGCEWGWEVETVRKGGQRPG